MDDLATAVAGASEVTDIASELEAASSQIDPNLGEGQIGQEPITEAEEAGEQSDPYADLDAAKLAETLKERDSALAQAKKDHANLQSMESRHYNEQREEMVKMRERVAAAEALANRQPEPDAGAIAEAQRKFDDEWAERVSPGDPEKGKATIELFRGMMSEYQDDTQKMVESKIGSINGKVREIDPTFQENKQLIDAFVAKGMSADHALLAVQVINAGKKAEKKVVSQPGAVSAPGAVAAATRTAAAANTVTSLPEASNATFIESLRLMGITSKEEIAAITKGAAKEYHND